jgi:hypothetical protein
MISASIIVFIGYLSHASQKMQSILEDHVDRETGEIFHYMWMARVTDAFCDGGLSNSERTMLLDEAEREIQHGDDSLSNLIAVCFVEHLPPPQESGFEMIEGYTALLKEYQNIFGPY